MKGGKGRWRFVSRDDVIARRLRTLLLSSSSVHLTTALFSSSPSQTAALRTLFDKYDTDGSGALDARQLLRVLTDAANDAGFYLNTPSERQARELLAQHAGQAAEEAEFCAFLRIVAHLERGEVALGSTLVGDLYHVKLGDKLRV